MGIVALAPVAERASVTRSGLGEPAMNAVEGPKEETIRCRHRRRGRAVTDALRRTPSAGPPDPGPAPIISHRRASGVQAGCHEVSIRMEQGVGGWRGECPRANLSMMTMRAPQQGQAGPGSGGSGAAASATGLTDIVSNARARARLSWRKPLPNSP